MKKILISACVCNNFFFLGWLLESQSKEIDCQHCAHMLMRKVSEREEVSFSSFSSFFCCSWWLWTKRNGPRKNVSWLLHNCPLFFLGKITKLLCTAENLQSWKKDHKNNFGYSSLAKQLEFISWKVNQFLWVSTKPCKAMKSFYIGSNVIITLLSFFSVVYYKMGMICAYTHLPHLLHSTEYQTT